MARPREPVSAVRARAAAREALRLHVDASVEARPGIYRMLSADGARAGAAGGGAAAQLQTQASESTRNAQLLAGPPL